MYLTDHEIREWACAGNIHPYDEEQLNPASYDLRLGRTWRDFLYPDSIMYPDKEGKISIYKTSSLYDWFHLKFNPYYKAKTGNNMKHLPSAILAITEETLRIPENMVGQIKLKTSPTRMGVGHPIADWVDPGYIGKLTLMLSCVKTVHLPAGIRIVQLVLSKLGSRVERSYAVTGHYNHQTLPTGVRTDYV